MNLGCLFWLGCANVHTHKVGQKELPPSLQSRTSSPCSFPGQVGSLWKSLGGGSSQRRPHIDSNLWQIADISLKTRSALFSALPLCLPDGGDVVSVGCSCVHLCSQGPHLWPFISSQVKGLRDNVAHRLSAASSTKSPARSLKKKIELIMRAHVTCHLCCGGCEYEFVNDADAASTLDEKRIKICPPIRTKVFDSSYGLHVALDGYRLSSTPLKSGRDCAKIVHLREKKRKTVKSPY